MMPRTPCARRGSAVGLTTMCVHSVLVKAWNLSTWPAYKSRLWNKEQPQPQPAGGQSSGVKRR